jgi:hypothetical protein
MVRQVCPDAGWNGSTVVAASSDPLTHTQVPRFTAQRIKTLPDTATTVLPPS